MYVADEVPMPQASRDEVLVRVRAAGVTPTELRWYPTSHTKNGEPRIGAIPGHELSGVVAAVGEAVSDFEVGDDVFGMSDWFADGAMAEFCVAAVAGLARKPAGLTHEEAASVPIGALTAWEGLIDRAALRPGERVLVHGASGAVGVYAIQVARRVGAQVVATASAHNLAFVGELGAEEVLDYATIRFEDVVRDVDVVFDAVGGDTLTRSWSVLRPGGRMVTIAADAEGTDDQRVKDAFFIVAPDGQRLAKIGRLVERGELRAVVDTIVPLSDAPAAFAGSIERRGRGKVVVAIGD